MMSCKNKFLLIIFISILQEVCAETASNKDITTLSIHDVKNTNINIYLDNTYITQDFDCKLDSNNNISLEFNNPELQKSDLQIYFDDGVSKIPASKVNYVNSAMDEDLIYYSWIGKTVEITGGGLGATVVGTLENYHNKKAVIKGINDRQYVINFNDPQGFKVFLKGGERNNKSTYKQIIKAFFANPVNTQGNLIIHYKTSLITSSIYYVIQKEEDNFISIDLKVTLKNMSNMLFKDPIIKIINSNYAINLSTENSDNDILFISDTLHLPLIQTNEFLNIDAIYPKNIHDLLVKKYKKINFIDAYVLDMSIPHTKKYEGMYITNHSLILNQKEIMPSAKVINSVSLEGKTILAENVDKILCHNKNTSKAHIIADTSNTVLISHSKNRSIANKNASVNLPDYQDLYWKTLIHNSNNFPVTVFVIYHNHYTIEEVSGGKLEGNNCIRVQVSANSKKEVFYKKSTK